MLEETHDNGNSYHRPNKAPKLDAPRSHTQPGHGSEPTFPLSPRSNDVVMGSYGRFGTKDFDYNRQSRQI